MKNIMALKPKKKSLADKISSLITAAPTNFGSDDEVEDTKAKVVEKYDESDNSDDGFRRSKIRGQNVDPLDQVDVRYAGKKISRKDVYSDDSDDDSIDNSEDEEDEDMENEIEGEDMDQQSTGESDEKAVLDDDDNQDDKEDEEEEDEDEDDDTDEEYDVDIGNPLYKERRIDSNFKTMSDTNIKGDIEKGNCVRSQLKIWENLLEVRIKLQKCLINSNQMPQYDLHKNFRSDPEFMKKTNETKDKLTFLLDNMLKLQNAFLKQYPETRNLNSNNKERKINQNKNKDITAEDGMDEEIPSDTEDEANEKVSDNSEEESEKEDSQTPRKRLKFSDYEKILSENHKSYIEYRNTVIQKWNDKTRVTTGKLNKGSAQTALKQIEFALNDKIKLRKRTQLKRSEYVILGKPIADDDNDGRRVQEYDAEIYDDDDFYHQLLRDLIEYKSSDVTDPIQLSKQWIQLQNMRRKMKRKIDTRATKGRRVRYNVHNKLVNFMAPITVYDTWTDLAKNELYNSLFGKIKPAEEKVEH